MRVNPVGIALLVCLFTAGYCFGGTIGLGIAAVIGGIIQLI
jgi:hypothetical protein